MRRACVLLALAGCGRERPSDEPLAADTTAEGEDPLGAFEEEALSGKLSLDGSSTVAPLMSLAAERFRKAEPKVKITVGTSIVVTLINAVVGVQIAWVLTRDSFPGKRIFDAMIDLPFALPTIVASIVLLSLYGPDSPSGSTCSRRRSDSASRCCS